MGGRFGFLVLEDLMGVFVDFWFESSLLLLLGLPVQPGPFHFFAI